MIKISKYLMLTSVLLFLLDFNIFAKKTAQDGSFVQRKRMVGGSFLVKSGYALPTGMLNLEFDVDFIDYFRLGGQLGLGLEGMGYGVHTDLLWVTYRDLKKFKRRSLFFRYALSRSDSFSYHENQKKWERKVNTYDRQAFMLGYDVVTQNSQWFVYFGFSLGSRGAPVYYTPVSNWGNVLPIAGVAFGVANFNYFYPRILQYDTKRD